MLNIYSSYIGRIIDLFHPRRINEKAIPDETPSQFNPTNTIVMFAGSHGLDMIIPDNPENTSHLINPITTIGESIHQTKINFVREYSEHFPELDSKYIQEELNTTLDRLISEAINENTIYIVKATPSECGLGTAEIKNEHGNLIKKASRDNEFDTILSHVNRESDLKRSATIARLRLREIYSLLGESVQGKKEKTYNSGNNWYQSIPMYNSKLNPIDNTRIMGNYNIQAIDQTNIDENGIVIPVISILNDQTSDIFKKFERIINEKIDYVQSQIEAIDSRSMPDKEMNHRTQNPQTVVQYKVQLYINYFALFLLDQVSKTIINTSDIIVLLKIIDFRLILFDGSCKAISKEFVRETRDKTTKWFTRVKLNQTDVQHTVVSTQQSENDSSIVADDDESGSTADTASSVSALESDKEYSLIQLDEEDRNQELPLDVVVYPNDPTNYALNRKLKLELDRRDIIILSPNKRLRKTILNEPDGLGEIKEKTQKQNKRKRKTRKQLRKLTRKQLRQLTRNKTHRLPSPVQIKHIIPGTNKHKRKYKSKNITK